MLKTVMDILAIIVEVLTGYTALLSIFCLLPRKKYPVVQPRTRFALLIAARNEENVIASLIESLQKQDYPRELYDILVIPNNCTDATEQTALDAGAKILHCCAPVSTKGEVLHQILGRLMGSYDAYCVFDADNIIDSQFLARMNDAIVAGARVAKSRQCALNPYDNWVSGAYDLYFQSINLLHSRARVPFRLSAKIVGTGFMLTDDLLQQLGGWNTVTLTEDIEFAVQCAMLGERVHYVEDAINYDEEPLSFRVSMYQRRRWSAGVQSVACRYTGKLLAKRPSWLRWDLAAHINMIFVQLLAFAPIVYGIFTTPLLHTLINLTYSLGGFVLGGILMGLVLSLTAGRDLKKQWPAVLLYPIFLASWYPLHIWGLFSKPRNWKHIPHGKNKHRNKPQEKVGSK